MSYPILLAERVRSAVDDAESFKSECSEVGKQVERLSQMLRTVVRFSTTTPFLYERPIRSIIADVCKNLERALALVRKCKRQSVLRRVVTIIYIFECTYTNSFSSASYTYSEGSSRGGHNNRKDRENELPLVLFKYLLCSSGIRLELFQSCKKTGLEIT